MSDSRETLIIIGAGGFGREILSWAAACVPGWRIKGFLDDSPRALAGRSVDLPILGAIRDYLPQPGDRFLCGLGQPRLRRAVSEEIKLRGGRFATLIHPTALVAEGARIAQGVIVGPYAVVSVGAVIEEGAAIYYHSSIDHDALIGPWSQISAHCDVTGAAKVGSEVFLGSHASILPGIAVGSGAVVGAGAVVAEDVAPGATVTGVPARERAGN